MRRRPRLLQSLRALLRVASRFRPLVAARRKLIAGAALALLLVIPLRLLEPWPLALVLDHVIADAPADASTGIAPLDRIGSDLLPFVLGGALVAIAGLRAALEYASTVGLALAGNRVLCDVRALLYGHVQRLSLSYHHRTARGDLLARLTADVGRLQEVAVTAALPLAMNTLTLVGMATVMVLLDWRLALAALAVFPLFSLSLKRRVRRIHRAARVQRRRDGGLAAVAAESLGAMREVQALSLEGHRAEAFSRQNKASLREGVQTKRLAAGLERRVDVLAAGGTAVVLTYGAHLVQEGTLSAGDLVVFMFYLKAAFKPMRDLAKYTGRLASAAASGERIIDVLDTTPDVRDRRGAVVAPRFAGRVRFEDVHLRYEEGRDGLRGVDLEINPGERVAVVGPSGAGKSTLVNLIPRLYDPDRGRVAIDGCDTRALTLASLRAQIAMVPQESVLFAVSVAENIAFGRLDADDAAIERAARLASAHEFVTALPDGYETVLAERGATLSGGQRQRIAIARAALRDAPIVILDEPTAGLDERNERAVLEALDRLTTGRTTVLIAHDLRGAERADRVVYMETGRVVESGTHAQLMAAGGRYAQLFALQRAGAAPRESSGVGRVATALGALAGDGRLGAVDG